MEWWLNIAAAYVAATYLFMFWCRSSSHRDSWLAFSGVLTTYGCFFYGADHLHIAAFIFCILFVGCFYLILLLFQDFPNAPMSLLAIGGPMFLLAIFKLEYINFILGFSYLTFRAAYLAYEVHIRRLMVPSFTRYIGFMFFPLTFLIGPISPYTLYEESLNTPDLHRTPHSRCLGRILVGILKCYVYSQLFKTMSFYSYWQSNYEHNFLDFTISSISTALYIYFNFSGACDIMIGAAALLGIRVQENFNNPFLSRNLIEYWTRNHITLTQVVRDLIFTPGTLFFARLSRGRYMLFFTSIMSIFAFFIVGVWHGSELGYALFGLMHGIGVVCVRLYGIMLRHMSVKIQRAVNTPLARYIGIFMTFMYVSYSSALFGNSAATLRIIWKMLVFT